MVLVGLMGTKCSGKSTAANFLIKHYNFVEKSMAEPLKRACQELFLFSEEQVFGSQEQKETPDPRWFGCTPRKALQYVGTELLRDNLDKIMPGLGKNIFTHRFKLWYVQEMRKNPNLCVVISDVRFQNEADFVRDLGGIVIKIDRPSVISSDMHPSEIELLNIKNFNYQIENTGTLNEFYEKIKRCMKESYNFDFNEKDELYEEIIDIIKSIPTMTVMFIRNSITYYNSG